jgi:hypothetical protein
VARLNTEAVPSEYYPPRARWYGLFFYLGNAVQRRLALDRIHLPREITLGGLVAGFLVPGLAIWLRGPRLWGHAVLAASAALILVFIAWLGCPAGNFAFGWLISLHCTGFVYYCSPLMAGEPLRHRLALTFLMLLAFGLLLYMPARWYIQGHWLMPLRLHGQVIVVQRSFQTRNIQRGDWVAYTLDENNVGENYHGGIVRVRNGVSLGPVLALAGDQVVFSTNSFSVNGILHTNLAYMPHAGTFTVPEKHWFIWPNLGISGYGDVGEARINTAMLGLADVAETNFFGKPFHRWFWRKQILS